ncbi:MAG: TIGR00299 family protein [Planctomycetes bacterium]|nr:TIGR00299 family protein [Planctomycetota bacterium]
MKTLLVEPFGGMAGDMFLAALCDLGCEAFAPAGLERFARSLVPEALEIEVSEVLRAGIRSTLLTVRTPESQTPPQRHLKDLLELLERCELSPTGKERAGRVLRRLGQAEARIHGVSLERVHLHEVGAVDTLVDVAGAVFALEVLGVERVLATAPFVGGGTLHCEHGELPVPAPATAALLKGRQVRIGPGGERCTPTAAALLVELSDALEGTLDLEAEAIGYGAGSREPAEGPPNLLRVTLGTEVARGTRQSGRRIGEVWLIECNLDDVSGEELGFLLGELRAGGALETWSVPVQMKKDRPGAIVSALCRRDQREALEEILFTHSPTLGVRWCRRERTESEREEVCVSLETRAGAGEVHVKVRRHSQGAPTRLDISPEYDDLARLAKRSGVSLRELESQAIELVRRRYD